MKTQIKKVVGAGLMSLGVVVGLAGYAGAQSGVIDTSGPDSTNVIKERTSNKVRVRNNNDLRATNNNNQDSMSGNASVRHNTTGGGATSGAAANANSMSLRASVDNSASSAVATAPVATGSDTARIENTGPDSVNRVKITHKNDVRVTNNNDVNIENNNTQIATSGDARVTDNTTGGSATSGDASNTNSTSMTFEIKN